MNQLQHAEAFCVMQYRCENDCREFLWNSRDGVTPFTIKCAQCGGSMEHVNWQDAVRLLTIEEVHQIFPDVQRVFVDASPFHKHIRASAEEYVNKWWDKDAGTNGTLTMRKTLFPMDKKAAIEYFIREWTKPGAPTVLDMATFLAQHVTR
jgi:hypothetical protein